MSWLPGGKFRKTRGKKLCLWRTKVRNGFFSFYLLFISLFFCKGQEGRHNVLYILFSSSFSSRAFVCEPVWYSLLSLLKVGFLLRYSVSVVEAFYMLTVR